MPHLRSCLQLFRRAALIVEFHTNYSNTQHTHSANGKLSLLLQSSVDSTILDHLRLGESRHALSVYHARCDSGARLSEPTFVGLLKACALGAEIEIGCHLHGHVARLGLLQTNLFIGNALIDMYIKWGCLARALEVQQAMSESDVVTWTALIGGHTAFGNDDRIVDCFMRMQLEGIAPNAVTFICMLKACGAVNNALKGVELHVIVLENGFLKQEIVIGNALLAMYAKCGLLAKAQDVFDGLLVKNVVSWNSLISSYAQHDQAKKALVCFEQMLIESICPNSITFICILNACSSIGCKRKGTQVHALILAQDLLGKDLALGNALVDMHAKSGSFEQAQEVFKLLPGRNVITWTALIAGYSHHDHNEDSLYMFDQMHMDGVSPNAVTYACTLKACGSLKALDKARAIHCEVARNGVLEQDVIVGNALICTYSKCGLLGESEEVFERLPVQDVVSWNTLISGYVQCELSMEALLCYKEMNRRGVIPNAVTIVCGLNGCGSLGAAEMGQMMHDEIVRKGLLKGQPVVGAALVDMYVKCGMVVKAEAVFNELSVRDLVSWNSLITGYAQIGNVNKVFHTLYQMQEEGKLPDLITFLNILTACSHVGLVNEGESYFNAIGNEYSLAPAVEHYICVLDLLSRAGQVQTAMGLMANIPFHPNSVMMLIVLGACRKWGNVELALQAFEEALEVDKNEAAAYSCMFNICASLDVYS